MNADDRIVPVSPDCRVRFQPATWVRHTTAFSRSADISTAGQATKAMPDEEMQAEIEGFLEGFNQPTYRGMRVNGVRVATWSSRDGWSGATRPDAEWLH
jgi:hypothetical protein